MKLAARAGRIVPSPTLSITATAKAMAAPANSRMERRGITAPLENAHRARDRSIEDR